MSSRSSRRLRLHHDKEDDMEDDKENSVVAAPENYHLNVDEYLHEIRDIEKNVIHSINEKNAMASHDMTKAHQVRCQSTEVSFVTILNEISKYITLLFMKLFL